MNSEDFDLTVAQQREIESIEKQLAALDRREQHLLEEIVSIVARS